jgi:hypothetical protein
MALTFPRDLATLRFGPGSNLYLERQETMAPTRGGLVQVAEIGTALWRAKYQTVTLGEQAGMEWEGWVASMRAGARQFRMVHPSRRVARAYPGGYTGMTRHDGTGFGAGICNITAIATTLDTVTLSNLPTSFVVSVGDLFSFPPTGSLQALHRVTEGGTAVNGVIEVSVEPTIRPGTPTPRVALLLAPWAKGHIDQRTVQVDWTYMRKCQVAFEAWQSLS